MEKEGCCFKHSLPKPSCYISPHHGAMGPICMANAATRAAKKNSPVNQQRQFLPFRRSLWVWKGWARQKPERCRNLFTFDLQSAWGISSLHFLTLVKGGKESSKPGEEKWCSFLEFRSWPFVKSQLSSQAATHFPDECTLLLRWSFCVFHSKCQRSNTFLDSSCLLKPHCKSSI